MFSNTTIAKDTRCCYVYGSASFFLDFNIGWSSKGLEYSSGVSSVRRDDNEHRRVWIPKQDMAAG